MSLRWNATPYRKRQDDEYADVPGFGRFRVCWLRDARGFRLTQNNERIGSIHATAVAAKTAAENLVEAAAAYHGDVDGDGALA